MPIETSNRHRNAAYWFVAAALGVATVLFLLAVAIIDANSGQTAELEQVSDQELPADEAMPNPGYQQDGTTSGGEPTYDDAQRPQERQSNDQQLADPGEAAEAADAADDAQASAEDAARAAEEALREAKAAARNKQPSDEDLYAPH